MCRPVMHARHAGVVAEADPDHLPALVAGRAIGHLLVAAGNCHPVAGAELEGQHALLLAALRLGRLGLE